MPTGLLDSYKIQFPNSSVPSTTHGQTYASAPQRRIRPRPSPRTNRIADASAEALRLSSQASRDYDQWLIKQYSNYNNSNSFNPPSGSTVHIPQHNTDFNSTPYDPANNPVHLRAYGGQSQRQKQRENQAQHQFNLKAKRQPYYQLERKEQDGKKEQLNDNQLGVEPWKQDNNNVDNLSTTPSTEYSRSKDPDRFGHEHAKWYNSLKNNGNDDGGDGNYRNGPKALVPNSKAKKEVLKIVSDSVLHRKKMYNDLFRQRQELKQTEGLIKSHFLQKLNIRFQGLAFEALPFEEALGVQSIIDQRLHSHFHHKLRKYLYDLDGEQDITSLIDEVDRAFHTLNIIRPVPADLISLFHNKDTTSDIIILKYRRKLIENRIAHETRYNNQQVHMLKRKLEECRIMHDRMTKLNELVEEAKEQHIQVQLEHRKAKKGVLHVVKEVSQLKKKLRDLISLHKLMLEKSERQINDDRMWQKELEKIQHQTKLVAKKAESISRSSAMKKMSQSHAEKKTLLVAEKLYQDKRLGPYKQAADKIFKATGVDSVEKILATFQDQSKKEMIMKELTEEKEIEKYDKTQLLSRLRKVLQRGMVAGVHVQQSDGNIESVEASLDHATKNLQQATERVVEREKLTNSCKAGIFSLCFKMGLKVDGKHDLLKTLDTLESAMIRMLEASYNMIGQEHQFEGGNNMTTARVEIQSKNDNTKTEEGSNPTIDTIRSPGSTGTFELDSVDSEHKQEHHPYETELRKKMLRMGSTSGLPSPCDSPNNIRISPTKKPLHFTINMKDGKLLVEKIKSLHDSKEEYDKSSAAGSGGEEDEDDVLDVLPHLLTPAELESNLRETINGPSIPTDSVSEKPQSVQHSLLLGSNNKPNHSALASDVQDIEVDNHFVSRLRQQRLKESLGGQQNETKKTDAYDNDLIEHRRVQKWSTATIVETYRKKLKKLHREAQVAKSEGRFDDANFIESSTVPKLKLRTHTHQLTALHEALMKQQKLERKNKNHKKHHKK